MLSTRLTHWLQTLAALKSSPRFHWLRPARRIAAILVVAASLFYVGRSIGPWLAQMSWRALSLRLDQLGIALALFTVGSLLGGWSWYVFLSSMGYRLSPLACLRAHATANLVKYLPGAPWQLVGKAYLTRQLGVPLGLVSLGMILELGCLVLTGLLVWLASMSTGSTAALILPLWARWTLGGLTCIVLGILPYAANWWGSFAQAHGLRWVGIHFRVSALWASYPIMIVGWVLNGLAFGCILNALHPLAPADWPAALGSLAISLLVGLLVIPAPAGLGVREAMITYTLQGKISPSLSSLAAILSRLAMTASEVLAFALIMGVSGIITLYSRSIAQKD
jgi:hypothetical protein